MNEFERVQSGNIHSVKHDGADLYVQFHGRKGDIGALWRYEGVPPEAHAALMAAESKGGHLRAHIIPRFPGTKVAG